MNRTLHDVQNAKRILEITADTMILIDLDGTCVDINTHSNLWFLQEEKLLGKNIFDLLPLNTRQKLIPNFRKVIDDQKSISKNYKLELAEGTYYFKCIMHPYDGKVLCQYRDITARSNVKLQLERTNHELKEIQKAAHIGQWKYVSKERMFYYCGYTGILCKEEQRSTPIDRYYEIIVEEDRSTFAQWLENNEKEINENSTSYRISYDGEVCYLRIQTYTREELSDGTFYMEGYVQNVTDIQRQRNDINILTHAINNAKESIFAAQKDGTLIFANRLFKQNHGISEEKKLNLYKIYDLAGDINTLEDWQQRCKQINEGGSSNFIAYQPIPGNKNILAFEGTMYHVTSDEGEISYWSFAHDITERLHYESQIKRLNSIMDTTMENLPAGIVVKDINDNFRYVYRNRESYNRDISFGNETNGMTDFDYYPQEVAEQKRKEDMEVATTGKCKHWVTEEKDKSGNLIILDKQKIKVEGKDFSPVVISIEWDITQLELMKRELMVSKEKAEISDNMKSAFLANMSHEIRTPLNAIVGFSRLIAESDNSDERQEYYSIVDANNERLLQLINEILDLSKIESGIVEFKHAPVRLNGLCKEIYDAHVFRTPQAVQLVYEPSNEAIVIDSDKNRIFQVLSNLIGNAFKFTMEGRINYGYRQEGEKIFFYVTDTGTGITPDKVNKVFERFMKLNHTAQGTGLGLSICKTIIERLGGEIFVTSEVGKGTTFSFWLPAQDRDKAYVETEQTTKQQETLSIKTENNTTTIDVQPANADKGSDKPTILIAEDTDSNYDLLNAILRKTYNLVRAQDGMEVVMMFEEIKPDLILMDIKMPNLNGLEATKIIRELSQDVPIIMQSAFAYEYDRNAAADAGCTEFIPKPIAQEKLKTIIKRYLKS